MKRIITIATLMVLALASPSFAAQPLAQKDLGHYPTGEIGTTEWAESAADWLSATGHPVSPEELLAAAAASQAQILPADYRFAAMCGKGGKEFRGRDGDGYVTVEALEVLPVMLPDGYRTLVFTECGNPTTPVAEPTAVEPQEPVVMVPEPEKAIWGVEAGYRHPVSDGHDAHIRQNGYAGVTYKPAGSKLTVSAGIGVIGSHKVNSHTYR